MSPLEGYLCYFFPSAWLIDRLPEGSKLQLASIEIPDSLLGYCYVLRLFFAAHNPSGVLQSGYQSRAYPSVRIEDPIASLGQSQDASFHQFNRELARVDRLLRVIRFHVRNISDFFLPFFSDEFPNIGGVLAERVPREVALVWPLEVPFAWVFRGHSHCIQIKEIGLPFSEP